MVGASSDALPSDEELLTQIAEGNRGAFTSLMRRHGGRVRGLALAFSGREADADDVTQDVFIMLWRRPQAWRPGGATFSTWLYRVVANRCLDLGRRQRKWNWLPFSQIADPVDETPSPLQALAGGERLRKVRGMVGTLPEKQRMALLLAVQGERSNGEIATILGVSEGAAEQLLVRARRKLREMINTMETVE